MSIMGHRTENEELTVLCLIQDENKMLLQNRVTPAWVRERLADYFIHGGYSVKVDSPFSGTMVPETYCGKDERVVSVMIEVNRGLYINDDAVKNGQYEMIKDVIHGAIDEVSR